MTHTATYTASSIEAADRIAAHFSMTESFVRPNTVRANFRGRTVERVANSLEFTLHASNGDHDLFEIEFNSLNRAPAPASEPQSDDVATPKQVSFLNTLIHRDPGAAMTVGASIDGATAVTGLTKSEASRMIDLLRAGV